MIVFAVVFIIAMVIFIWHTLSDRTFKEERLDYICRYTGNHIYLPRTKTNWNMIAMILNIIEYFSERGFEITKEVKEMEKEIKDLEKQKKRLEYLEKLEMRRDKLFEEVNQKSNN